MTATTSSTSTVLPYRLGRSGVHGTGVFATRAIRKGTRILEYTGERVSHREADRRYADKPTDDNHTFLFTVDAKTVIDAGVRGNEARFINHSCDPNCEAIVEDKRVFIEATRAIAPGEELAYDYRIGRSKGDPPEMERIFGCRCGAATCRGTMLAPREKPAAKKRAATTKSGKTAAKRAKRAR